MIKITLKIDGMACSMCEAHMNDAVREAFKVKKVTSSHKEKETVILTETEIPEADIRAVVEKTGYKLEGYLSEVSEKKGFFSSLLGK
ncbi:MAG: heavy-metal-associated domain-containing protein [Oscillospiraceae bacterium]|nr:heavy-metal-associated domain-containing protein [Oscillospiraceae bacterium]